jgi:hypothetical protein
LLTPALPFRYLPLNNESWANSSQMHCGLPKKSPLSGLIRTMLTVQACWRSGLKFRLLTYTPRSANTRLKIKERDFARKRNPAPTILRAPCLKRRMVRLYKCKKCSRPNLNHTAQLTHNFVTLSLKAKNHKNLYAGTTPSHNLAKKQNIFGHNCKSEPSF